jgi:hypothetical protein
MLLECDGVYFLIYLLTFKEALSMLLMEVLAAAISWVMEL